MSKVELNTPAPDFTLTDFNGNEVSLSDFRGNKNVLLVFNRGFF
jgi:peroxiredoxin